MRGRPPSLPATYDAVCAHYGPEAMPISTGTSGGREFRGYCAPEEATDAFLAALDVGPDREDIQAVILRDARTHRLPPGLKIALVQHALAMGSLPGPVERECMGALALYCDPGDPRRLRGEQYLNALGEGEETR